MFNTYPYTDFHELNLDYILDLCRRTMGLHLETSGDFLKLVNQAGDDISKLKVTYADKALTDMNGHDIRAFILDAGVDGRRLVFDRGNGEYVSITVPYATSAEQDVNGVSITDYVKGVSVSGDNVLITFGNGSTTAITVPFATKANQDINGKVLTTYVAELSTGNDKLIVKDGDGVTLAELTIPYAVKARNDYDGDDIRTTYGTDLTVGQTTVILRDKETNVLSEITVPYAVSAQTDNNGAPFRSSYGAGLTTGSNKVQLTAPNGTVLSDITVPFASTATDATNAIESVSVSGDNIVFTTYGGQAFSITCPYAVKALKDDLNNTLSHTYIANAVNDPLTGKITFYAQDGSVIAEMTPTVDRATHDNLGNDISDYIKTIVTDPNSNYVTVTHGDGTADSLTINYATKAWKDTYGNVIGNVYIRSLAIITDSNTGKKVLVAYNGELSELFRIDIDSETAVNDVNGTPITDYVVDVTLNGTDLDIEHGDGTVDSITLPAGVADCVYITITGANVHDNNAGDQASLSYTLAKYDGNNTPTVCTNAEAIDLIFNKHTKVVVAVDDSYYTDPAMNTDSYMIVPVPNSNQVHAFGLTRPYTDNSVRLCHLEVDFDTEYARVKVYGGVTLNAPIPDDLNDLTDVNITTPANGDLFMYDSNSGKWVNSTLSQALTNNISYEQISVNTTILAGQTHAVTLSLVGDYTNPPTIFTPMLSSAFTSDVSIEYVRLSSFSSLGATVNVQLKNESASDQTVQGLIYIPVLTR